MAATGSLLFLTDRFPPDDGGLARSAHRLACAAADAGWRVQVLVLRASLSAGTLTSVREGPLLVHRIGAEREAVAAGQRAAQIIEWLQSQTRFELYHGHYGSTGGFLAAYHARLSGAASYLSLRGNDIDRDLHDPLKAPQLLWALRNADAMGAVSPHLAAAARVLGERWEEPCAVRYTPNSVDCELFHPQPRDAELRASLGLNDGPVLGFAGELRHKKGTVYLLEALRRTQSLGTQLLVLGPVRPDARQCIDAFREEHPGVAARLCLAGSVREARRLPALYALMDLALCPSLWEGMPNFVLEAMACARPVVTSDAGALPELVHHGETGWVVPRHALHRFGEAVEEVLSLPETERLAIAARGREHVAMHFSPERERRELLEGYAAALHSAQARRSVSR